ncbi:PepSY-associated TM helix domain-containing protein [Halioxenophilus aromaticivorans]|uniref:PepSY-associated TM helix domain-containing protein n=1 Tax=Halioxenophilus aromaticivorans TaxID=1306992 RepID=A0AAV3U756_9ALTE
MKAAGFRASMLWLHTWSSLILGWLLFAVFLTGTLVFFREEITYWMEPELHQSVPADNSAEIAVQYLTEHAPLAQEWRIELPDDRHRTLDVRWRNPGDESRRGGPVQTLDASTGEALSARETAGANFLYRFHFELYGIPREVGRTLVGIATMLMLIGLITGIIIHKNIFKDFFSFRTQKSQRGFLDAHAFTAVFALPFHLMITFSGLVLLAGTLVFWNNEPRERHGAGAGRPVAQVAPTNFQPPPLQAIISHAEQHWGQPVASVEVSKPGSVGSEITVSPTEGDRFSNGRGGGKQLIYDGQGNLVEDVATRSAPNAIAAVANSLVILHQAKFSGPILRWSLFISGALGTAMVATGLIFWVRKRKKQQQGQFGYELVNAVNLASIAGLMIATAAYFWASRLLPVGLEARPEKEIGIFFGVWLLCLLHAGVWRHRSGWIQQLGLLSVLLILIPLVDTLTSPTSLLAAISNGDWQRIGFDGVSLFAGLAFAATAVFISQVKVKRVGDFAQLAKGLFAKNEAKA